MTLSSRPWQIRKLSPGEFPWEIAKNLDFDDQILIPQADKKNRLFIAARCSECNSHYYRRAGELRTMVKNNIDIAWLCAECRKSERWPTSRGYIMVYRPKHPNSHKNGNMFEHVLVMSEMLGRPLSKDENVHHKNGSRMDNRPENLELWSKAQPAGQRVEDKVRWAVELKDAYPQEWRRVRAQMLRDSNAR